MSMKKKVLSISLSGLMAFGAVTTVGLPVGAVGNGPNVGGSIQTSILHTYDELVDTLKNYEANQEAIMELEVIGQTVKGRDIYMAKYISNPENPTILF